MHKFPSRAKADLEGDVADKRSLSSRSAMSLLEMLLALSLTVVMLSLIGQALYFHLYTFQSRRDGVEQSQIARALLQHMANDLRSAVSGEALDTKGLDAISLDPTQLAQSAGVNLPSGALSAASSSETEGANAETAEEETAGFTVGFYGDLTSLQFDITRLPRLDEYDPQFAQDGSGAITRIPADVRTVSYALEGEMTASRVSLPAEQRLNLTDIQPTNVTLEPRGLLRTEQEVALAGSALLTNSLSEDETSHDERLADDITRLQFLYFDGYEWWPEWNSDDRGGLPLAVEIIVGMANASTRSDSSSGAIQSSFEANASSSETLYRLVVKIPVAVPLPYEEETTEMEASENSSTEAMP
jgi:subtilisin family serine protease